MRKAYFPRVLSSWRRSLLGPDVWIAQVDPLRRTTSAFFPRNLASSRRSCGRGAIMQQDRPPIFVARLIFPESFGTSLPIEPANLCDAAPARRQEMQKVVVPRSAKTGHFLEAFAGLSSGWERPHLAFENGMRSHRFAAKPENMAVFSKHFDVFPKRTCAMHFSNSAARVSGKALAAGAFRLASVA